MHPSKSVNMIFQLNYKRIFLNILFVLYATAVDNNITNSSSNSNQGQQKIPLVRLPSNSLLKYTAYKDVSILHFRIPFDTRTAYFSFKAYEEGKGAFRKCANTKTNK